MKGSERGRKGVDLRGTLPKQLRILATSHSAIRGSLSRKTPLATYTPLIEQFNPVKFDADADAWVSLAKEAGMKYMVLTSKHHEGFCLFDSVQTDFDVMSSPFKRDILRELAAAARRQGMRLGWYYSILDWHHPDYLPRRPGDERSTENAKFERYLDYMRKQLDEVLGNYGPIDVIWFDGDWDNTWNRELGREFYRYILKHHPSGQRRKVPAVGNICHHVRHEF